ncbi:MAG: cytochrome c family protein [Gammaproteobacteria bacterium]|jgi:cytochrome c|nr:cytochrome c family protein [Gammaproteobacteria bacterium]|tara:strand:+ start:26044 stop:26433 length:390 start_codon:yes stop_codon:yes gene_type:complete
MYSIKFKDKVIFSLFISALSFNTLASEIAAGEKVFVRCKACHEITPDKSKVGPSLYDVIGRKAGSLSSFPMYTDAMKNSNKVWDESSLSEFLKAPMKVVKGTRMIFTGLPSEQDRSNLIAYLKTLQASE